MEKVVEPWSTKYLTIENARSIAMNNCKAALAGAKQSKFLFRGFNDDRGFGAAHTEPCLLIDAGMSHRTSADTNNFYQAILDVHPSLAHVPSRSNSIICGTDISIALSYTNNDRKHVYLVLPFDSAGELAISKHSDFLGTPLPNSIFRRANDTARVDDFFGVSPKMSTVLSNLKLSDHVFKDDLENASETLSKINPLHLFFELDINYNGTGILFKQGGNFNNVYQVWRKSGQKHLDELSEDDLSTVGKKLLKIYNDNPLLALAKFILGEDPKLVDTGPITDIKRRGEVWFSGAAIFVNVNNLEEFSKDLFEIDI